MRKQKFRKVSNLLVSTFASGLDEVTGTRSMVFPKNKMYKTTVSKTLDIRQSRTVIPGRWETSKVSTACVTAYCLERVSGLCLRDGELRGNAVTTRIEERVESPGRPRCL